MLRTGVGSIRISRLESGMIPIVVFPNTNSEEERGLRGDEDLWLILFVLISYMNSEGGMLTRMLK